MFHSNDKADSNFEVTIVSGLSQMAFKHFFWPLLQLRWVDLDTQHKRMTYKRDYSLESILWVASLCFSVVGSQPWSDFIILSKNSEVKQTNLFWLMLLHLDYETVVSLDLMEDAK